MVISGYTDALGATFVVVASLLANNPGYEKIKDVNLNVTEMFCLAQNIWHESQNTSLKDKKAVGFATLNRVKYSNKTKICDVVWERDNLVGQMTENQIK